MYNRQKSKIESNEKKEEKKSKKKEKRKITNQNYHKRHYYHNCYENLLSEDYLEVIKSKIEEENRVKVLVDHN